MKHKVKVVTLPTDGEASIRKYHNRLVYHKTPLRVSNTENAIFQNIYITVSQNVEPIKEGDWYINSKNKPYLNRSGSTKFDGLYDECKKIIATNDCKIAWDGVDTRGYKGSLNGKSLLVIEPLNIFKKAHIHVSNISHISQSFLKEFADNPDGEWEIQYYDTEINEDSVLKMNPDRSVIITSVEEKRYNIEEIENLATEKFKTYPTNLGKIDVELKKWIKKTNKL
jgi:hypothetical protein